ncbi:MAG: type II toxin-antitoxin system YafQ family toxin [Thermodesulfovibrionales bacterium]|nr:type II toxin-antitoxin system YafQ family toxin [Thermodesulfovibrionales bacterium]
MLNVKTTNKFEKDFELMIRQGKDIEKLKIIMRMLAREGSLDQRHRDHKLTGNYISNRECHVEPDWLLVYRVDIKEKTITFVRTGSHSGLFG